MAAAGGGGGDDAAHTRTLWMELPPGMDESSVHACFSGTGAVVSVKIPRSRATGGLEAYAFVEFASRPAALAALRGYNGHVIPCADGAFFRLNWANSGAGKAADGGAPPLPFCPLAACRRRRIACASPASPSLTPPLLSPPPPRSGALRVCGRAGSRDLRLHAAGAGEGGGHSSFSRCFGLWGWECGRRRRSAPPPFLLFSLLAQTLTSNPFHARAGVLPDLLRLRALRAGADGAGDGALPRLRLCALRQRCGGGGPRGAARLPLAFDAAAPNTPLSAATPTACRAHTRRPPGCRRCRI